MAFASNYNHFTGTKKKIRAKKKDRNKKKNIHQNKYQRFSNAELLLKKRIQSQRK